MGYLRVLLARLLVSKVEDLVRILDAFEARLTAAAKKQMEAAVAKDVQASELRADAEFARVQARLNLNVAAKLKDLVQ